MCTKTTILVVASLLALLPSAMAASKHHGKQTLSASTVQVLRTVAFRQDLRMSSGFNAGYADRSCTSCNLGSY